MRKRQVYVKRASRECRARRTSPLHALWLLALFIAFSPQILMASSEKPLQAVIFDCDGVLVDTEYAKFLAWKEALASENISFTFEEYFPLIGHSGEHILSEIRKSKQKDISDHILDLKTHYYRIFQRSESAPIHEVVHFALELSKQKGTLGIKLALASSGHREEIQINLERIGLENAFDCIVSGSDDLGAYLDSEGTNKPKPYIYLEVAKRLDLSPDQCLVFEDSAAGVTAAARAGMVTIALPHLFTRAQDFSAASATLSYEDLSSPEAIYQKAKSTRYTFVLTPPASQYEKYVEASRAISQGNETSYQLNAEGTSSPHITIVQFACHSPLLAEKVWFYLCAELRKKDLPSVAPNFSGVAFVRGAGSYEGTTWIELSADKGGKDSPLMKLHETALETLEHFGITPLNATRFRYRPHLTLARMALPGQIETWSDNLLGEAGPFTLKFGLSDEKWQYAKTMGQL